MKKIIVDLDVVTVAHYPRLGHEFDYNRKQAALAFLESIAKAVKSGKVNVVTPKNFYALLGEWQYKELVLKILDFYNSVTSEFVETAELIAELVEKDVDYESVMASLVDRGVKGEDALIIALASLKRAVIVTYNKKDLRGKLAVINKVLSENALLEVEIKEPSEFEGGGFSA